MGARDRNPRDGRSLVRAVVRALDLLRTMNARPLWSLQALHEATGLPKSTLSRLLGTLIGEGYVRAEKPTGTYGLTAKIRELDAGYGDASSLVEAGRAIALEVTRRIKWPLAIGVFDLAGGLADGDKTRVYRSSNLMINILRERDRPRDVTAMSPHAH